MEKDIVHTPNAGTQKDTLVGRNMVLYVKRKSRGWSLSKTAKEISKNGTHISREYYYAIERGWKEPSPIKKTAITETFGIKDSSMIWG
jgi:hypothetical protein